MSERIITLTGVPCFQNGKLLISGSIRAKDLIEIYEVDEWKLGREIEQQGCQRPPIRSHFQRIGRKLKDDKRLILPTALVLSANTNHDSPDENTVEIEHLPQMDLMRVIVPKDHKLRLVDGQHRVLGAAYAIGELDAVEMDTFHFPFVLMIARERVEEIRTFYEINTTSKKVSTDLALQLLNEWDKHTHSQLSKSDQWKVVAINVAMELNNDPQSVWYQSIYMSGTKMPNMVLTSTAFVRSLSPLLQISFLRREWEHAVDKTLPVKRICNLLNNYWNALKRAMPEPFEKEDRKNWYLQRNIGARVWHYVAPFIIEECMVKREKVSEITEDTIYAFISKYCGYGVLDYDIVWSYGSGETAKRLAIANLHTELSDNIIQDIEEHYLNVSGKEINY